MTGRQSARGSALTCSFISRFDSRHYPLPRTTRLVLGEHTLVHDRISYGKDQAINAIPIASSQTDHAM
jgi:hypothetical protein